MIDTGIGAGAGAVTDTDDGHNTAGSSDFALPQAEYIPVLAAEVAVELGAATAAHVDIDIFGCHFWSIGVPTGSLYSSHF